MQSKTIPLLIILTGLLLFFAGFSGKSPAAIITEALSG